MTDTNEAIWQRFMAWLPGAPSFSGPRELFDHYRARNIAAGMSAAEVEREDTTVQSMLQQREDAWPIMFDNIYAGSGAGFTAEPNALLAGFVRDLPPGRALDIGMGQGRNAVFLATKGWQVTGFDVSDRGLAIAEANARRAGVELTAVKSTEATFDYGIARWDLIVFMYEPFAITTPGYVERLQRAMAPGAHIVIESFSEPEGTPNRPGTAIDAERLLPAFRDFRLIHFEDRFGRSDWGPARRLVRLIAMKRDA